MNDGRPKPPGSAAQPAWAPQPSAQPWGPPQQPPTAYGSPSAPPYGAPPTAPYGATPAAPGYGAPPPQPGYGSPPASPYGTAPQSGFIPQNPYASPYARPGFSPPSAAPPGAYGDAAGEHLRMTRGRFGAWPYVVLAFLMQIGIVTALFGFGAALLVAVAGIPDDAGAAISLAGAGTGLLGGVALAYFVFRDRLRCIEAFSSRFCSGLMNLSLLYVPAVALVYANVRGVQKLRAR